MDPESQTRQNAKHKCLLKGGNQLQKHIKPCFATTNYGAD